MSPGPVTDERAHELRARYHALFAADELPVPVEAIASDLLGLYVEEAAIDCSGLLFPAERRVVVNAGEPEQRRRFTLAHEVGHWVCQVLEGHAVPIYCRAATITADVATSRSWGVARKDGEPEERGQYSTYGRATRATTAAASGIRRDQAGLRPAGVDAAQEREANVFAAELLMPEPAVHAAWAGSIPECAETFGVSEEAMHWRLYNLKVVSSPPA